jgi:pimeloyl-ACP methyl ester carboxylesterase
MGLGGIKSAWQRQTKDFGHDEAHKYSCLVIDNRGIGESDRPLMRYSTTAMALDLIEVLDHIDWTGERELHVIGVSMGGMIAQELALEIPQRIASLTLMSTGRRIYNTVVRRDLFHSQSKIGLPVLFRVSSRMFTTAQCFCREKIIYLNMQKYTE